MHGHTVAFCIAGGVFALGAVIFGVLRRSIKFEANASLDPEPAGA